MSVGTIASGNLQIDVYPAPVDSFRVFIKLVQELGGVCGDISSTKLESAMRAAVGAAEYDPHPVLVIFSVNPAFIGDQESIKREVMVLVGPGRRFVLFVAAASQDESSEQLLAALSDLSNAVDVVDGLDNVAGRLSEPDGKFSQWMNRSGRSGG